MKILKTLGIGIGIFIAIAFLINMLRKAVKTRVMLHDYNKDNKTVTLVVYANDKPVNTYVLNLGQWERRSVQANDYRIDTGMVGSVVAFNVFNDKNQSIALKYFDFRQPQLQTIFEEK